MFHQGTSGTSKPILICLDLFLRALEHSKVLKSSYLSVAKPVFKALQRQNSEQLARLKRVPCALGSDSELRRWRSFVSSIRSHREEAAAIVCVTEK